MIAKIKHAKEALFSRVHILIEMLSQHLVALTNTVNSVDPEKNEVIHGRSANLKESVERLQRQIKRWEHRICHIVISLSPLKEKLRKLGKKMKLKIIKTKGGHKVLDASPTAGRVGQPEEAGHPHVNPPIKLKIKY